MNAFVWIILISIFHFSVSIAAEDYSYEECLRKAVQAQSVYKIKEAEQWYRRALKQNDSDPNVQLALARTLFAQLKHLEALQQVEQVLEQHPKHADAQYFLCRYYWKVDKNIEKAETHGQRAIKYDSTHQPAKQLLGEIYISQHSYAKAESIYRDLIQTNNSSAEAYFGLGNVLIKQERYEAGIAALQKAATLDPNDPEPHRILALAHAKQKDRETAQKEQKIYQLLKSNLQRIDNLLRELHTEPDNADLWFELGKEYIRQQYPAEKAIEALKKGLYFDRKQPEMHNLIGTLYLNENQAKIAQEHLRYAISLAPNDANIFNNLGVACLVNQDFDDAVNYLKKSIDLGNDDPGVKQNLKFAEMKLKEKDN